MSSAYHTALGGRPSFPLGLTGNAIRSHGRRKPGLRQGGGEGGGRRWEESRGRTCEKDKREIYVGSESFPLAEQLPGINRNGIRPWRRALA